MVDMMRTQLGRWLSGSLLRSPHATGGTTRGRCRHRGPPAAVAPGGPGQGSRADSRSGHRHDPDQTMPRQWAGPEPPGGPPAPAKLRPSPPIGATLDAHSPARATAPRAHARGCAHARHQPIYLTLLGSTTRSLPPHRQGLMARAETPWAMAAQPRVRVRTEESTAASCRQSRRAQHGQRRAGTEGSQFFITFLLSPPSTVKYSIFGQAVSALDTLPP